MSKVAIQEPAIARVCPPAAGPMETTRSSNPSIASGHGTLRRGFDALLSGLLLIVLSPVLLVVACAVLFETGWPVLFRQTRVGRHGQPFSLLKFRSMRQSNAGPSITAGGDSRITPVGKFLRKYKLDELPQLWNVVRGEMSLVGPRPEVAQYVNLQDPVWQTVLSVRPGITDPASLAYRHEEELLAKADDPLRFYRETVLPAKLALNVAYLEKRTLWLDLKVILQTARSAALPESSEANTSEV